MKDQDYIKAVGLVLTQRRAGAGFLRQHLLLSDSKIQRLLKTMEREGIISKPGHGGAREILKPAPIAAPPAAASEFDSNAFEGAL